MNIIASEGTKMGRNGSGQSKATVKFLAIFLIVFPFCSAIMSSSSIRRQASVGSSATPPLLPSPGGLAEVLLPPPALSASFPTLRPRKPASSPLRPNQQQFPQNNNNIRGGPQQPPRDLIPPFRPSQSIPVSPTRRPPQQNSHASSTPAQQSYPLLPPIEIPPERPLTDNEILQTTVPKETSFIPTTGQGVIMPSKGIAIPSGAGGGLTTLPVSLDQTNAASSNNSSAPSSSVVRFPTDSQTPFAVSPPLKNCPSCECTNEVDYICASSGVLYLNSCSFDCATFCDPEIRKVPLQFCSSQNQTRRK